MLCPCIVVAESLIMLSIKGHFLKSAVVSTPKQRQQGLSKRREFPANFDAMLFVYSTDESLSFWMKETYFPLTIAFIDARKKIVDLIDMQPLTTVEHQSSQPVRYALEVSLGWFVAHDVNIGDVVQFTLPES